MGAVFGKLCPSNEVLTVEQKAGLDFTQFNKQVQAYKTAVVNLADRINEEREEILKGEEAQSKEVLSLKVRFVSLYDQLRSEADVLEESARKADKIWKSQSPEVSKELSDIVERHKNQALRIQSLCKESKLLLLETELVRKKEEGVDQEQITLLEQKIQEAREDLRKN